MAYTATTVSAIFARGWPRKKISPPSLSKAKSLKTTFTRSFAEAAAKLAKETRRYDFFPKVRFHTINVY